MLPSMPRTVPPRPDAAHADIAATVESVGTRIRDFRRERGWTQDDLAQATGVSRSAVAQWETDRAGQIRGNITRIADALGISVEVLLHGAASRDSSQAMDGTEWALLRLYRECLPEDRDEVLRMARSLARRRTPGNDSSDTDPDVAG